jgi:tetratricopeptide (TPR) repeat protein
LDKYDAEAMALFLQAQLILKEPAPEFGIDDRGRRAVKVLRQTLAREPKSAALWRFFAQAHSMVPDHREAVVAALQSIELGPEDARAHWIAGSQLRLLGKPDDAEPHLVKAAKKGIEGEDASKPHHYLYLLRREQGRTDAAIEALGDWADAIPEDRYPHQLRARLLWDVRRHDEALEAAVETLHRAPDDRETRQLVGQYFEYDALGEIAIYERILKSDWVVPQIHDALRRAYDRLGRYDLALEHLEWVIVLGSHDVVGLTKRTAWLQHRMHDPVAVHRTVSELLAAHEELASDPELHELRGAALEAQGKWEEALAELGEVGTPPPVSKLPTREEEARRSSYARCAVRRIDLHLDRGRTDLALEAALGARQVLDPRAEADVRRLLRAELRVRLRARDYPAARDTLAELGESAPVDSEIDILLGEGRTDDAIESLAAAIRERPDRVWLVSRLATEILRRDGLPAGLAVLDEAELRLDAALDRRKQGTAADETYSIEARTPGLHSVLDRARAALHQEAGDAPAAEAAMRAALVHRPNDAGTLNDLAYMWAGWTINLEEAESLVLRALEQQPYNGGMQDTYGWVLFGQGDYEGALQALELANRYHPREPENLAHLGRVYARLGRADRARARFEDALREIDESRLVHRTVAEDVRAALRALDAPAQTREGKKPDQQRR